MNIRRIGVVRNGVQEGGDAGWGQVLSELQLLPEFAEGLRGLEGFSHAMVVFLMHGASFDIGQHLVRRPRERADMPLLGAFAHRAQHRPNPNGGTTVRVERIDGASLFVRGLDAVDGTPVLDIKPHFPAFDSPAEPTVPAWVGLLMRGYF